MAGRGKLQAYTATIVICVTSRWARWTVSASMISSSAAALASMEKSAKRTTCRGRPLDRLCSVDKAASSKTGVLRPASTSAIWTKPAVSDSSHRSRLIRRSICSKSDSLHNRASAGYVARPVVQRASICGSIWESRRSSVMTSGVAAPALSTRRTISSC